MIGIMLKWDGFVFLVRMGTFLILFFPSRFVRKRQKRTAFDECCWSTVAFVLAFVKCSFPCSYVHRVPQCTSTKPYRRLIATVVPECAERTPFGWHTNDSKRRKNCHRRGWVGYRSCHVLLNCFINTLECLTNFNSRLYSYLRCEFAACVAHNSLLLGPHQAFSKEEKKDCNMNLLTLRSQMTCFLCSVSRTSNEVLTIPMPSLVAGVPVMFTSSFTTNSPNERLPAHRSLTQRSVPSQRPAEASFHFISDENFTSTAYDRPTSRGRVVRMPDWNVKHSWPYACHWDSSEAFRWVQAFILLLFSAFRPRGGPVVGTLKLISLQHPLLSAMEDVCLCAEAWLMEGTDRSIGRCAIRDCQLISI